MPNDNLDLFAMKGAPGVAPTFTVSGFVSAINQTLNVAYPTVEVEGEVSGFNVNQGKFVFFDLKDETSSVGCFMMAFSLRVPLEDGMRVKVTATPKLTDKGRFSLTIKKIELSGEGSLKRAYELLKVKLEKEGIFDPARKRSLPVYPSKVGIISSVDSAGYKDFQKIANELWGGVDFQVAHVQVQGDAAPDQIISAIKYMNELADVPEVLVVVRGGGSLEDLAPFNDELVTRAIASSRIPTLVGVGHEIDTTLAELAADVRASTPSNAAQILLPDKSELVARLGVMSSRIEAAVSRIIDGRRREALARIEQSLESLLQDQSSVLASFTRTLKAYDPREALKRGYSIARRNGQILRSGATVKVGDSVMLELSDSTLDTEVKNVNKK